MAPSRKHTNNQAAYVAEEMTSSLRSLLNEKEYSASDGDTKTVGHARFGATLMRRDGVATAHTPTAMILGPATFGTFFFRVACAKWRGRRDPGMGGTLEAGHPYCKISLREEHHAFETRARGGNLGSSSVFPEYSVVLCRRLSGGFSSHDSHQSHQSRDMLVLSNAGWLALSH